jgi:hypothetical protein
MNAMGGVPDDRIESYNPTDEHLTIADQQLSEANEHLKAAKKLLAFEDKACTGLTEGERSACPLLASSVARVEPTNTGFTLRFKPSVDVGQTTKLLTCHLAYAVATGFDRPSCPLFVKGTTLRAAGATGLEFIGDSATVGVALRTQARRIFTGIEPWSGS